MKLSVVGCGYLGAVHAAAMAKLGHDVIGYDVDQAKVRRLTAGEAPFYEPGFAELLKETVGSGRLTFTTDATALEGAELHFIAVGTPQQRDGYGADLSYLDQAIETITAHLNTTKPVVIAGKSTVPVGTAERIEARLDAVNAQRAPETAVTLAWNPEFLREGFAVQDTLSPDRIVYGLSADEGHARQAQASLDECYRQLLDAQIPRLTMDYATAELVKVSANSFLATKISFINAMGELCEKAGGDVVKLAEAIGYDERIGAKFLRAGVGFGGGCLPKDIRAFMARADELGCGEALEFLREVDAINQRRRARTVELANELAGGDLTGVKVCVLGATFKPNSDDLRDSPALDVARQLVDRGADVTITDVAGCENVHRLCPDLTVTTDLAEALRSAEVTLLLTEWGEYKSLDPKWAKELVNKAQMVDGRNVLDRERWAAAGWTIRALGRADR